MEVNGAYNRIPSLYAANVRDLYDEVLYEKALTAVSDERREKTARLRFREDRARSVGAELLLRYALKKQGIEQKNILFSADENGKPCFGCPSGLYFNLSHSGEYVLAAVSGKPVGCDIERIRPGVMKLAKRIYLPEEYEDIASQDGEEAQEARFFYYWTLKESFMKVTGLGMRLPPSDFSFTLSDGKITVCQQVNEKHYEFRTYEEIPGYRAALASEEADLSDTEISVVSMAEVIRETVLEK